MHKPGQLFYLMGASGAGKDSLIQYARQHFTPRESIKIAKRYITRPISSKNDENHHAINLVEFKQLLENGFFAMHWSRHGLQYGVSKEIDVWLEKGKLVIINGSRQYYHRALEDYPGLHALLIRADQDILHKRLLKRRRELPEEIEERMQWAAASNEIEEPNKLFSIIENNAALETAGEKFLDLLQAAKSTQL